MIDERQVFERVMRGFVPPDDSLDRLVRRRDHKRRNQRIGAVTLAIILALVSFVALARAFRTAEVPADEPTPKPQGIFSEVGGWIVYGPLRYKCEVPPCGHEEGIWAVDPTHPDDPTGEIQLSTENVTPLAWSSDGSRLLILRFHHVPHQAFPGSNLFVLNADGTETRLTKGDAWITGGSFSPDGSEVVYATDPGIFVVDTGGATPPLLLTGGALQTPTFSPDGSKIAYFAWRRQRFRLQMMNADGTGSRALSHAVSFEDMGGDPILVWSPDGTHLAIDYGLDIYTVRADGSDLTVVIRNGGNPNWSPDGSRIAYNRDDFSPPSLLAIADADGKNTQGFAHARSGPWNPLVQPEPGVGQVSDASEGPTLTSTLLFVVALMALTAMAVLIRRRMEGRSRA